VWLKTFGTNDLEGIQLSKLRRANLCYYNANHQKSLSQKMLWTSLNISMTQEHRRKDLWQLLWWCNPRPRRTSIASLPVESKLLWSWRCLILCNILCHVFHEVILLFESWGLFVCRWATHCRRPLITTGAPPAKSRSPSRWNSIPILWMCTVHKKSKNWGSYLQLIGILTYLDTSWHVLTYLDISWHILTRFDISWHILTHLDTSWHILTDLDTSW